MFVLYVGMLSALMKHNRGYNCWAEILAREPWMSFQCDFSAMISPEHFKRFILPELEACCRAFPKYNFYHIDGKEQLRHLDFLLDIPGLRALQWTPGVDKRPIREWMPLFKKIRRAGKKIWYTGNLDGLEQLADALGSLKGVYWQQYFSIEEEETARRIIERFGS
jgi:5-methyltetrahydrofolate--homocysteine methyltransferase